ncbi:MAG TPA: type IV pilus twitching motility protein PilT [Fimbriimonadaceae bacterium]|nr:Twitching mobility protein [Fimbriimonadaceae bacterium]MCL4285231.1 type IV pilus twitching motility protein PilT [Fimbriimonadaceae bacterium]MCZ7581422.1 type IV pilus twitching motility protein PilT [Fimbriimonadaceae bacterium]HQU18558.1 type IV pilus twitching motility protein PilT [Fimbriimonadaceae bacterium]
MLRLEDFLRMCVEKQGSDVHFKTDAGKIYLRIHGDLELVEGVETYSNEQFTKALYVLLNDHQIERFQKELELDFALEIEGVARFRGNAYQQRGYVQAAFRVIPYEIQSMEELHLPEACYDFIDRPRGLVLVTGPAGSGKSTTLAAMIDRINRQQPLHIVTVEDPIEFVHADAKALINQRELDVDTNSFANALKYVLRQDPDVILVGEMRDLETIHLAITAAETGHLVFGTLHTVDAIQTVDRIVDVFPTFQQQQIRMQLSVNLVGVLSQTLVKRSDNRGRIAAFETLVATSAVRNLVRENKTYQIGSMIQTGARQKMHTLDQSLARLVEQGLVRHDEARSRAKDPGEFDRLVALAQGKSAHSKDKAHHSGDSSDDDGDTQDKSKAKGVRGQPFRPAFKKESY